MLSKIWQFLKQLFQQLQIIFPLFPKDDSKKHPVTPLRLTRTDAEYESIFMELLEEVNLGRSSGNLAGFLMMKGVKDTELVVWLRLFGERLLGSDNPSVASLQELARRLVLLSEVRGGELGGVAADIGRGIFAKFPPPIVEEDWRGKVIEAVFVEDGLGGGMNRKSVENTEGNEEVNQEAEEWLDLGKEQYEKGDFEGAIVSLYKSIKAHNAPYDKPGYSIFLWNRGKIIVTDDKSLPVERDYLPKITYLFEYSQRIFSLEKDLPYFQQHTHEHKRGRGLLHHEIGKEHYSERYNKTAIFSFYELCNKAIASYNEALTTLTKEDFPEERLEVLQDLIKAYLSLRETAKATQLERDNKDLLSYLLAKTQNPTQQKKLEIKLKLASFQQLTVNILVQCGNFIKAIETAEKGKNTCLSWLLADDISPKYPEFQQLLNLTTAVIYWHLSDYALHTFIIKYGKPTPIVIGLETDSLTRLYEFEKWVKKWNQEYTKFGKGEKPEGGAQTWRDDLEETLKELGEILNISAIEEELKEIKNLILIPHRDLHRFPIHALFADEFTISYLPSAKIGINLVKAKDLDNKSQTSPININPNASPQLFAKTVLSLENPHSTYKEGDLEKRYPPLPAADIESEMICQMFANSIRIGENDVTRDRASAELQKPYNVLHFTGHGSYEFFDPQKSALFLSGSDRLTVREIISIDLSSYELICLSACETAVTGNQTITTEYVGLVSAFMGAKAKYVLSTLWPVQSAASALLVIYFYQQLQAGHREATALAIAQKWLRDATREDLAAWYQAEIDKNPRATLRRFFISSRDAIAKIELDRPYQHPYYWAAFTLTGL